MENEISQKYLTKKEEILLIRRLQKIKVFCPEQQKVEIKFRNKLLDIVIANNICHIIKTINYALRKFNVKFINESDFEILINESIILIVNNINNFDTSKNIKFFPYIKRGVAQIISRNIRFLIGDDDVNEDITENEDAVEIQKAYSMQASYKNIVSSQIKSILNETLDKDELFVIVHYFGLFGHGKYYFTQICDFFGQTEANMRKKYKSAMEKLKKIENLKELMA